MSNVFFHHLLALTSKLRGTLPVLLFYLSENSWCFSFALLPRLISWLAEARAGTAGPEDLSYSLGPGPYFICTWLVPTSRQLLVFGAIAEE